MSSMSRAGRLGFDIVAAPLVLWTGWRIARIDRRVDFTELLERARSRAGSPLPGWLARPEALASAVERWLSVAPPRRYGVCLRRALLLLDLWSRCGLRPRLHLGFRLESPEREGHAWLSAVDAEGLELRVSGPRDFTPTFEL